MEAEQQKKLEEEAKMRVAMLCLELLLMVQITCTRLVVYPIMYKVWDTSQMVVWDF